MDPHILAVADEDGGLVIYDTEKVGPRAVQHGMWETDNLCLVILIYVFPIVMMNAGSRAFSGIFVPTPSEC